MNKPRNVQLISDGRGMIILLVDGQYEQTYEDCGSSLPFELEGRLCQLLTEYPGGDEHG